MLGISGGLSRACSSNNFSPEFSKVTFPQKLHQQMVRVQCLKKNSHTYRSSTAQLKSLNISSR